MSQVLLFIICQGDCIVIVMGLCMLFVCQVMVFYGVLVIDLGKMVVGEMLVCSDIFVEVIE